jgi:hypothetical protein
MLPTDLLWGWTREQADSSGHISSYDHTQFTILCDSLDFLYFFFKLTYQIWSTMQMKLIHQIFYLQKLKHIICSNTQRAKINYYYYFFVKMNLNVVDVLTV